MKTVVVLGDMNSEMRAVEKIISPLWEVVYKNCLNCSDAYNTNKDDVSLKEFDRAILLECDYDKELCPKEVIRIGNYKSRNCWEEVSPDFLPETNLGRLLSILAKEDLLKYTDLFHAKTANYCVIPEYFKYIANDDMEMYDVWTIGNGFIIPKLAVYAAASNYCIPHAYLGKCKGVNSSRFFEFRTEELSRTTNRFPFSNKRAIQSEIKILNRKPVHPHHKSMLIRSNNIFREEAAYVLGIDYVYSIKYSLSFTLTGYIIPEKAQSWCNFMKNRKFSLFFDRWSITARES